VVDCLVEPDVNADPGLAFFDGGRNLFAMSFGDLSPPTINPIGREGLVQRCFIMINEDAELGDYPLNCAGVPSAASAEGDDLTVECVDGTLRIEAPPTPTDTPDVPTPTNTPTRTNTPRPTDTAQPTSTRSGGGDDDDGCQVVAPANSSAGWLLLIPAAALLWQRRRSR
jgi:MYXO-CTERM domain-containing protein